MFGGKQRIGLAHSSLEKETYESLKTEEDLEKTLEGLIPEQDQEGKENVVNAVSTAAACSICEAYGVTQLCKTGILKVHIKCVIEIEREVVCDHCCRCDAIREQREIARAATEKQAGEMLALSHDKLPPA
nr:unnamed protein product [Callosobruchus analis]